MYEAMKDEVARRGAHAEVWVTRTACLGVCPKTGCAVAEYPRGRVAAEVTAAEAVAWLRAAMDEGA